MRWRKILGGSRERRWHLLAVVALLAALVPLAAWGLGRGRGRTDPIWERIQRDGVIRVGMDASFPPFETLDAQGHFLGYDVDLANELARRLGIGHVTFVNIHFDGLYDALLDGKCDIILSALPFDRERTEDVAYTVPYFHAGQVMVVGMAGQASIRDVEDLAGETVAVEMGSEAHSIVRQLNVRRGLAIEVRTTYSAEEALDLARAGETRAAIADAVTVFAYTAAREDVWPVGEQLTDEPYVIAAPLEGKILLDRINRALADMAEDGYRDSLLQSWF